MSSINNLVASTELDAVNTLLSVIGEAPLPVGTNLSTATQPDVLLAIQTLRTAAKEVQSRKWRFNTEFGYSLTPTATQSLGGVSCNIFVPPTGLVAFDVTRIAAQSGLDLIIRPSRVYTPGTLVFYDRLNARDGIPSATFATLKIDPVWLLDFEAMPEAARRYVTIVAARAFQQSAVGSPELDVFTAADEQAALSALEADQRLGYPVVSDGTPASLTDCLNVVLASAGLEPLASVNSPMGDKQAVALNVLRNAVREVQRRGWKFNTEFGFQIAPTTNISWVDTAGVTTTLNVFLAPENLCSFKMTSNSGQQGSTFRDVALMASRQYTVNGAAVQVFYDRVLNRDGFKQSDVPYLYIDPVWYVDFSNMPEVARWYCTILAVRRFTSRITGVPEAFTDKDEMMAKRALEEEQGEPDNYNIFNSLDVARTYGGRGYGAMGVADLQRNTPGRV